MRGSRLAVATLLLACAGPPVDASPAAMELAIVNASPNLAALVRQYGPIPGRIWATSPVTIHTSPGGTVLARLSNGCTVSILARSGAWYRIVYLERSAWVHARGVLTMAASPLGTEGVYRSRVTRDVDLRNIPGGPTTSSLESGTPIQIVARTWDYLLVESAQGMGYIPIEVCADAGKIRARTGPGGGVARSGGHPGYPTAHQAAPAPAIPGFQFPVKGGATFGNDFGVGTHSLGASPFNVGIDLFARRNTPILAPVAGIIERTETQGIGGRAVFLDSDGGTIFYFAHMEKFADSTVPGRRVRPGDVLGYVGTTGNAEGTSPHLHFAGVVNGKPFNPIDLLHGALGRLQPQPAKDSPPTRATGTTGTTGTRP